MNKKPEEAIVEAEVLSIDRIDVSQKSTSTSVQVRTKVTEQSLIYQFKEEIRQKQRSLDTLLSKIKLRKEEIAAINKKIKQLEKMMK